MHITKAECIKFNIQDLPSQPLDDEGERQLLWIASEAGGLKVHSADMIITVITPRSPLDRALIGKAAGEGFEIAIAGKNRCYEVSAIY